MHNIKRNKSNRKSKHVGRGGTRGKTSGRGTKGQNARAGRKKRPEMRDIIKRFPKLRGRGKNFLKSIQTKPFLITTGQLETMFASGETANVKNIIEKGIISNSKVMKIIAGGALSKKLTVSGVKVSAGARAIIEKAGGKID